MAEIVLRPASGVRAFMVALTVVGDLVLLSIPLLVTSSGAAVVIAMEVFMVACAAGLTWFNLKLINARVVVGADQVVLHWATPRPVVVMRDQIVRVSTGATGRSWRPILHLKNGSAVPVTALAARSERAAETGTGRLNQALSAASYT